MSLKAHKNRGGVAPGFFAKKATDTLGPIDKYEKIPSKPYAYFKSMWFCPTRYRVGSSRNAQITR